MTRFPHTALPLLVALHAVAPVALGQDEEEHRGRPIRPENSPGDDEDVWLERETPRVDLAGLRARIEERGLKLTVDVITDTSWPLAGGLRHRRTDRALTDVALEVDLGRALGLEGTLFFAEFYSLAGRDASADVGDIQAFSNIDGEHVAQLAELWLEHTFEGGRLRLKAGKLDANSSFAFVDTGLGFLHSSAGFSPTIFPLPTYPDPALSLNVFARPLPDWHVGVGVYNAQDGSAVSGRRGLSAHFEEAFLIGQVSRRWGQSEGRLALGAWHHTGAHPRFDGGMESGAEGLYALLEQRLYHEHPLDAEDTQGLTAFVQWGGADGDLSTIEGHLGAGLVYTGLIPDRDSWETGLYASHVDLTNAPGAGLGGTELALELYQELRLTSSLSLKPDLQVIVDPSGSRAIDDAWVATIRMQLSL